MMRPGPLSLIWLFLAISHSLFSQDKFKRGLDFDDESYLATPRKAKLTRGLDSVPAAASIKQYAPFPGNQGDHGTCTAWASSYCGRTIVEAIKNGWTDRTMITEKAFSPAFLFRMLKPTDGECHGGTTIGSAFATLKNTGTILYSDLSSLCTPAITPTQLEKATQYKIKDFMRLFDMEASSETKINSVKKAIAEKKPVVIGMTCPDSFSYSGEVWNPTEQPAPGMGGHAMCVVGYDDSKYGGAFEIQNSWGLNWANQGYVWIRYQDFAKFTRYAHEFIDLPDPKPEVPDLSGQLRFVLADGQEMPANLLVSTRGLTVVPAKTAPGPLTLYRMAQAYTSGTQFRMYISNNQPAFVYAISSDLSNEVSKIFPYEEGVSAALTDKKNDVALPDEDHFIEFDNKPGKDFLCVLYSRDELNLNDLVQKIGSLQGTFSDRIFKVVGSKMVEPKNISFSKDKLAFEGFSKGKSVVAMMVELEHR